MQKYLFQAVLKPKVDESGKSLAMVVAIKAAVVVAAIVVAVAAVLSISLQAGADPARAPLVIAQHNERHSLPGKRQPATEEDVYVAAVLGAQRQGLAAPLLSKMSVSRQQPLSDRQAYAIQRRVVASQLKGNAAAGFKAGLTSAAAQKKFAVSDPVAGVLFTHMLSFIDEPGYRVQAHSYHRPMMEAELGFRLSKTISEPVANIAALKMLLAEVRAVIELPDLGFSAMPPQSADIIANNVLAKRCLIKGSGLAPQALDINRLSVKIFRDGEMLLAGESRDAMGDQWQALLWLVNHTVSQGYTIEADQWLITGAIGKMLPLTAGHYRVNYGVLGEIDFLVD